MFGIPINSASKNHNFLPYQTSTKSTFSQSKQFFLQIYKPQKIYKLPMNIKVVPGQSPLFLSIVDYHPHYKLYAPN